eukprot:CAMPEP_0180421518 /NCGR_PEP_ID=MMETSP1036_2-20121128/3195_1 /TAXON_ID=632150 /ORGANISM="Azadinium spinosum, Strain 3D9" /LENGTH=50 /DNA_ID=CAMNT_0022426791 /DNA_START=460 /DNA_END=612 /DNA_ORIENTATION=+
MTEVTKSPIDATLCVEVLVPVLMGTWPACTARAVRGAPGTAPTGRPDAQH